MKFRQYSNGKRYIVFDASDSELLPIKVESVLRASEGIKSVVNNGVSIEIEFYNHDISKQQAREFVFSELAILDSATERESDITTLENNHPLLHLYIKNLQKDNYELFKRERVDLLIALYHFFLYDFTCNFKDSNFLWCVPFFNIGVFDVYGGFHGDVLLADYRAFLNNTNTGESYE